MVSSASVGSALGWHCAAALAPKNSFALLAKTRLFSPRGEPLGTFSGTTLMGWSLLDFESVPQKSRLVKEFFPASSFPIWLFNCSKSSLHPSRPFAENTVK